MAKQEKTNTDDATVSDQTSKIDAIKHLLFGENIQEYNSEFEAVKRDILEKKKELEHLIDDVKAELLQNIDNLSTDINIRITELENTLDDKTSVLEDKKLDRKIFGDLLIKLGEKISQ